MYVTQCQRHHGEDALVLKKRDEVYQQVKAQHPERWSGRTRNCRSVARGDTESGARKTASLNHLGVPTTLTITDNAKPHLPLDVEIAKQSTSLYGIGKSISRGKTWADQSVAILGSAIYTLCRKKSTRTRTLVNV